MENVFGKIWFEMWFFFLFILDDNFYELQHLLNWLLFICVCWFKFELQQLLIFT